MTTRPMRFLCDQMLARLGRWLRAAGYDTVIVDKSLSDEEIFKQAKADDRLLLTRDKSFYERCQQSNCVIWLEGNSLNSCVKDLTDKIPINWLLDPFSRCLICNTPLIEIDKELANDVPDDVLNTVKSLKYCDNCGKTYWEGSHFKRMLDQLHSWNKEG